MTTQTKKLQGPWGPKGQCRPIPRHIADRRAWIQLKIEEAAKPKTIFRPTSLEQRIAWWIKNYLPEPAPVLNGNAEPPVIRVDLVQTISEEGVQQLADAVALFNSIAARPLDFEAWEEVVAAENRKPRKVSQKRKKEVHDNGDGVGSEGNYGE